MGGLPPRPRPQPGDDPMPDPPSSPVALLVVRVWREADGPGGFRRVGA